MNADAEIPPPISPAPEFKNRRGGLIAFGVFEILLGCLQLLFVPLMLFGQFQVARMQGTDPNFRQIIPGALFYAISATAFIWLGIGSILARRWARALWLVLAWIWLVCGLAGSVAMAFMLPKILETMTAASPQMPPGFRVIMAIMMVGILIVFFLLLPLALVLFYRSQHVKATCDARDPVARWTDGCPLPVLALVLLFGFSSPWLAINPVTQNGVLPGFGLFLSGLPGTIASLTLAALLGYAAWASYHLKSAGWWVGVIVPVTWCLSSALTFAHVDPIEMYRLMGYPEQQIQQIQQFSFLGGNKLAIWSIVVCVPWLGFMIYIRRFFRRQS